MKTILVCSVDVSNIFRSSAILQKKKKKKCYDHIEQRRINIESDF